MQHITKANRQSCFESATLTYIKIEDDNCLNKVTFFDGTKFYLTGIVTRHIKFGVLVDRTITYNI